MEFLTYAHDQRRRKIIEHQLRGVWVNFRETVKYVGGTSTACAKQSVIRWQNPLLHVIRYKYRQVAGTLIVFAGPVGLPQRLGVSASYIPGDVDQLEGDHVASFWNRSDSV